MTIKYLGHKLKNPFIMASSGLTKDIDGIKRAYDAGASAIVLKSYFEEQINVESTDFSSIHPEGSDDFSRYQTIDYLHLIENSRKDFDIPIIASINCVSKQGRQSLVKDLESAGASAIEINVMSIPKKTHSDLPMDQHYYDTLPSKPNFDTSHTKSSTEVENELFEIVKQVKESTTLPIVVKLYPYYTSIQHVVEQLATKYNVEGVVLFNAPLPLDFNLKSLKLELKTKGSSQADILHSFRWISLLHGRIKCDLSASTGIATSTDCIKFLLAGANSLQLCSSVYKKGYKVIDQLSKELSKWMKANKYDSIDQFHGTLNKHIDINKLNYTQYSKLDTNLE